MMFNNDNADAAESLIRRICQAFDGFGREDGVTLHQARAMDDYRSDAEQLQARELDRDSRWQDIPDAVIEELGDALTFLCPKGFRYYLPAFMIFVLRHYRASSSLAIDCTIYNLQPDRAENWSLLNSEQLSVTAAFVRYFADPPDPDRVDHCVASEAFNSYWHRFLTPG